MMISNELNRVVTQPENGNTSHTQSTRSDFANLFYSMKEEQSIQKAESAMANSMQLMQTSLGDKEINLHQYFSKNTPSTSLNLEDVPLLLPTQHNIETLSKYSEQRFKQLMDEHNIPEPPATIEFDSSGEMVLPSGYPYADQLRQAFNEAPEVAEALRTTTALASHYAGIMEAQPWRDEMLLAKTQSEREQITEKYSYLFDDNRPQTKIILAFTGDGSMLIGGDNPSMNETLRGNFWPDL